MKIAVVGGTAGLGFGLALRLASGGDEVIVGSRTADKGVFAADKLAERAGNVVQGGENREVVRDAEVVLVAVPYVGQAGIYQSIKDSIPQGAPVIDCTVPLASEVGGRATRTLGIWEGSAAQQAKAILGRGTVMGSGFHTVMAGALDSGGPIDQDVLVCGDGEARTAAKSIVERIEGARYVDCGPLENARILESITALLIGINHRYELNPGAGIKITRIP